MGLSIEDEDHPKSAGVAAVARRYVASFVSLFKEVDGYRAAGDTVALTAFFHRVKGTSAMLGMADVSATAAECEQAAMNGDTINLEGLKAVMRDAQSHWDCEATQDGAIAPNTD